jgi:Calx-beta domain
VIFDAAKKEGKSGTTSFVFTVALSDRAIDPVTVSYTTVSGTAKSSNDVITGADFVAASGTLTIPVGSTSKTITVSILGDKLKESNETFFLNLSNPSPNAYLGDGQALGTIQNDD